MSSADQNLVALSYREKAPVSVMKEIIQNCLKEKLTNIQYDGEKCGVMSKQLAEMIRQKLKSLGYERYKYIVQVLIGERRDQGVRMGSKCFWDSSTDSQASENFMNDYIYAVATVYAVYLY